MRSLWLFCCCLFLTLLAPPCHARQIADVNIAETVTGEGGTVLHLNGAGIRSKLIFKIYIAELYLTSPSTDLTTVLSGDQQKRIIMHFLYKELSREKMVEVWNEGFAANTALDKLPALRDRINQFNAMWVDVKAGDEVVLTYLPAIGTRVIIAGVDKGVVVGKDFADALLAIWLGEKPASDTLKKELLGLAGQ